jgi:hypothetical protein
MAPQYPLTVRFEDGTSEVLDTPVEVAGTLEWFDTDDPSDTMTDTHGTVIDARGRPVRLKVEALEIVTCELLESAEPSIQQPQRVTA